MDLQDLIEIRFRLEAEQRSAARVELRRPAGNDTPDHRISLTLDQRHRLVARDTAQGLDLFADQRRETRHGEVTT